MAETPTKMVQRDRRSKNKGVQKSGSSQVGSRQKSSNSHHRQLYNMHLVLQVEAQKRQEEAVKQREARIKEECTFKPDLSLTKNGTVERSNLTFQRATATSLRSASKQTANDGSFAKLGGGKAHSNQGR